VSVDTTTVLTVSYDGSAFHGFARQAGIRTVQGFLEEALRTVLRWEVVTAVAGRTDTGVHALGQVVSFDAADGDVDSRTLLRSVGALVAPDVVVTGVRAAARGFSARYDAVAREYRYRLVPGPVAPVFLRGSAWWCKGSLDLAAMRDGAEGLIGQHDFRSFCVTASVEGKRTVREIELLEIEPACELGEHCIVVRIVGRSFLHSMVRIVVGSLVEVGKGRRDPAWIGEALAAGHRAAAGPTAPAEGLTLWHVTYPDDVWL